MRKQGRRWASLLLVLAMLMGTLSLPAYATKLVEGTNGRTIYLSTEITSEENEKIDTVDGLRFGSTLVEMRIRLKKVRRTTICFCSSTTLK